MITADLLDAYDPLMAGRIVRTSEAVTAAGGDLYVVSGARSRALQAQLRFLYTSGQRNVLAADPNEPGTLTPWGWWIQGSAHMVQQDGHAWAIDFGWSGITADVLREIADRFGLRPTEPTEDWHYMCFNRGVLFDELFVLPAPQAATVGTVTEGDMTIHTGALRPGTMSTYDVTFMPANGERLGSLVASSHVVFRPPAGTGTAFSVEVWCDGTHVWNVPVNSDGKTAAAPITASGQVSLVSPTPLVVEGREVWAPA